MTCLICGLYCPVITPPAHPDRRPPPTLRFVGLCQVNGSAQLFCHGGKLPPPEPARSLQCHQPTRQTGERCLSALDSRFCLGHFLNNESLWAFVWTELILLVFFCFQETAAAAAFSPKLPSARQWGEWGSPHWPPLWLQQLWSPQPHTPYRWHRHHSG